MGKIAKVLRISKAINHPIWRLWADLQRATPFQGRTQRVISKRIQEFSNKNSSIFFNRVNFKLLNFVSTVYLFYQKTVFLAIFLTFFQ